MRGAALRILSCWALTRSCSCLPSGRCLPVAIGGLLLRMHPTLAVCCQLVSTGECMATSSRPKCAHLQAWELHALYLLMFCVLQLQG